MFGRNKNKEEKKEDIIPQVSKWKKENKNDGKETIIGPFLEITGDFCDKGNVIIDGKVTGSIKTDSDLQIGPDAIIKANIKSKNSSISGFVEGDIKVQNYLEITSSAKIVGNIECAQISIQKGAKFEGKCTMNTNNNVKIKNVS